MSLINRMLQDLDARAGQPGAAPLPSDVRPVPPPERGLPWRRIAIAAGAAVALAAAGFAAWHSLGATPAGAPAVVVAPPAAPAARPAAPAAATPVVAFEVPVPPRGAEPSPKETPAQAQGAEQVEDAVPLGQVKPDTQKRVAPEPAAKPASPVKPTPATQKPDTQKRAAPEPAAQKPDTQKRVASAGVAAPAAKAPVKAGKVETPAQRAENAYRRGLANLEDGRVTEAVGQLQDALRADPRHEAARQTLVSLLIEAKRPEEAMRQLGAALALDPRQPAMAMVLARLQLERGSPGIDTLMRTLPYAAGNGEYHAFLAGALAREGRQREAAEHYQAALRTAPQNGVWWMGLGISLQAEKRNPEAAGAYQKALDSGVLSAELQGFVERKLKQLNR